eukprot:GHRQ01024097.1.p1 GENE.GHRQ01024097.1~~GHRQ01024097.1.p1  ORF type:complete len:123 (+),score=37.05 GHRQ01024097.1:1255-1623(+)
MLPRHCTTIRRMQQTLLLLVCKHTRPHLQPLQPAQQLHFVIPQPAARLRQHVQLFKLRARLQQALQQALACRLREHAPTEGEAAQAAESCKALVAVAAIKPELKAFAQLEVKVLWVKHKQAA